MLFYCGYQFIRYNLLIQTCVSAFSATAGGAMCSGSVAPVSTLPIVVPPAGSADQINSKIKTAANAASSWAAATTASAVVPYSAPPTILRPSVKPSVGNKAVLEAREQIPN